MMSKPKLKGLTAAEEAAFDRKAEKHFKSHRELPSGRNFRCWNRNKDVEGDRKYLANYDAKFRGGKSSS